MENKNNDEVTFKKYFYFVPNHHFLKDLKK